MPSAASAFRLIVFGFRFGRLGRFDETHQDEARNGCGANGDGRTFANKIACLVYQIVDILVIQRRGCSSNRFGRVAGIVAILVAEFFVDCVRAVVDHPGQTLNWKSVVKGKSVSVRVELGGRRNIKKKTSTQ